MQFSVCELLSNCVHSEEWNRHTCRHFFIRKFHAMANFLLAKNCATQPAQLSWKAFVCHFLSVKSSSTSTIKYANDIFIFSFRSFGWHVYVNKQYLADKTLQGIAILKDNVLYCKMSQRKKNEQLVGWKGTIFVNQNCWGRTVHGIKIKSNNWEIGHYKNLLGNQL